MELILFTLLCAVLDFKAVLYDSYAVNRGLLLVSISEILPLVTCIVPRRFLLLSSSSSPSVLVTRVLDCSLMD